MMVDKPLWVRICEKAFGLSRKRLRQSFTVFYVLAHKAVTGNQEADALTQV